MTLQNYWRGRKVRKWYGRLVKGVALRRNAEDAYLEHPSDIVCRVNYALYVHAILGDYDRARKLWIAIVEFMTSRGPDNAFVLYGYAIYLASTLEEDFGTIRVIIERARAKDPGLDKFELAELGFYRQVRRDPAPVMANSGRTPLLTVP